MVELASIIILGIFAQWIAWKVKVPAILPLILIGLMVGPISTLWTEDGTKWLAPTYSSLTNRGIFPQEYLFYFVSLAIGIILFEGGLTLKRREITGVGSAIVRLITIGSLITFIGAGLAAHFIMNLSWPISFLFAALIIVTGPTVIAPILQNVPLNRNVATVLKWEGILIDPIGALVAVLVFEFIRSSEGGMAFTSHAFIAFFRTLLIGSALGGMAGFALYQLIKNELIPHYLLNVFTLAFVLMIFVFADVLEHESGLLAVVSMGTVLGNMDVPRLNEILSFKESLSILLISMLFILLAANITMDELALILNNWRSFALFAFVALILRPIGVFASTYDSDLRFKEKLFISWVGPRGIVAAGIASLFGITLARNGVEGAEYITPLVFMIVLGTVILNATTARLVARILKVTLDASNGILIIGSNQASRVLGKYLQDNNRHVVIVDNNNASIRKAQEEGLEAFVSNIYTDDLSDHIELTDIGYLLAMTSSMDVNKYAVKKYRQLFGEMGTYRIMSTAEGKKSPNDLPPTGILSYTDDYLKISEVARDNPVLHEVSISELSELKDLVNRMSFERSAIPIFLREGDGNLILLPQKLEDLEIGENAKLVYMGKKFEAVDEPEIVKEIE